MVELTRRTVGQILQRPMRNPTDVVISELGNVTGSRVYNQELLTKAVSNVAKAAIPHKTPSLDNVLSPPSDQHMTPPPPACNLLPASDRLLQRDIPNNNHRPYNYTQAKSILEPRCSVPLLTADTRTYRPQLPSSDRKRINANTCPRPKRDSMKFTQHTTQSN